MNPCIDKSTFLENVVAEQKLRCKRPRFEPGGGGINVSRAVRKLGGHSTAYYFGNGATAVAINTNPVFRAQIPETLFHRAYYAESGLQWDISHDGQRFLMIKESNSPRKIIITTNWFEELIKQAPME
jgi:hypothetical protein